MSISLGKHSPNLFMLLLFLCSFFLSFFIYFSFISSFTLKASLWKMDKPQYSMYIWFSGHNPSVRLEASSSRNDQQGPKETFNHRCFIYVIRETYLKFLWILYQVPPKYRLEASDPGDKVCDPPRDKLALYKEYFWTGVRLPLHHFFIHLLRYPNMSSCLVIPNSWYFIYDFIFIYVLVVITNLLGYFLLFVNILGLVDGGTCLFGGGIATLPWFRGLLPWFTDGRRIFYLFIYHPGKTRALLHGKFFIHLCEKLHLWMMNRVKDIGPCLPLRFLSWESFYLTKCSLILGSIRLNLKVSDIERIFLGRSDGSLPSPS